MSTKSESDIQAEIVDALRLAGWFVTVTSQDRSSRRQLSGLPDLLAFRDDKTLLIECKRPGETLHGSQRGFLQAIEPHMGKHLVYVVMDCIDDVTMWLNWGREP